MVCTKIDTYEVWTVLKSIRPSLASNYFDLFDLTRSCAALRAADLDWIVRPEYSLGGKEEGVQGRNKQKCDTRGVTTDLLDV